MQVAPRCFAGRPFGRSVKKWGAYLYVKKNAVGLAREELAKMPESRRRAMMLLSSVTDPYQGHEAKYRLGQLDLADFHWGHTGSHVTVEITYRARIIKVALGFWVKPTDAGWVVAGPVTHW